MGIETVHSSGLGGSGGDSLVSGSGALYMLGTDDKTVWFVDSATGNDSNDGKTRLTPFATLGAAVSAVATTSDIVVLMSGHTETVTSAESISTDGTIIVGEGSSSGKPTVKLTMNSSSADVFTVSATACQIRNIWFEEQSQANSGDAISVQGADGLKIIGCYFEADENSNGACVRFESSASDDVLIKDCTFASTATDSTDGPQYGVYVNVASCLRPRLDGCVFDGGTVGWAQEAYYENQSVSDLSMESISLLRSSNIRLKDATDGYIQVSTLTGSSRVWST